MHGWPQKIPNRPIGVISHTPPNRERISLNLRPYKQISRAGSTFPFDSLVKVNNYVSTAR